MIRYNYLIIKTHLSSQFFTTNIIILKQIIRINKYRSQKATFKKNITEKISFNFSYIFLKRLNSINKPRFKRNGFKHILNAFHMGPISSFYLIEKIK